MAVTAGRLGAVTISTTAGGAGAYTAVKGVNQGTHSIDRVSIDVSAMGVDWIQRILGLGDGKLSLSGFRDAADVTGQNVLRDALLTPPAELWVQYLYDGTNGYKQQVVCTKFSVDGKVASANSLTIDLEGTGAITKVGS